MSWKSRLKAHFALARPVQLFWFDIILPTAVFVILSRGFVDLVLMVTYIIMSILGDAGGCTLNDIGDLESDKRSSEEDRNQRPLVTGATTIRAAYIQGFVLLGLCLLMSFYRFPLLPLVVLVSFGFALSYSFPPFKFKARPILSQLFWVVITLLEFSAMVLWMGISFDQALIGIPLMIGLWVYAAFGETLAKDLRDWDNDAEAGFRTTVVTFGPRLTARVSAILGVGGSLILLITLAFVYHVSWIFLGVFGILVVLLTWKFIPIYRTLGQGYQKPAARSLHRLYLLFLVLYSVVSTIAIQLAYMGFPLPF